MEYLFWILVVVLLVRWAVLTSRLRRMEQRIEEESARHGEAESRLLQRVANLEVVAASLAASAKSVPSQATETAVSAPVTTPATPALSTAYVVCQFCGRQVDRWATVCACGAAVRVEQHPAHAASTPPPIPAALIRPVTTQPSASQPSVPPRFLAPEPVSALANNDPTQAATSPHVAPPPFKTAEPLPLPIPQLSLRDRLRAKIGDQEWEALVGGSWLNKLGVLILVIGIALYLGYEFTRVGAAVRVAMGLGVSLIMLIGGVLIERRPLYAIFGRGLIGGGWAALYFTTYAMHAVDAAKVIENPYVGMILLLAVACGMIAHSLRYHSQTVTGLAYFIAFATLALSESTPFSVLALIPLAGSLLVLAYRFDWTKMAVFGLFATYATCASRPDTGAPLGSTQALFGCYWLLFESFDIMRIRKRRRGFRIESLILPMNALGFLVLSLVKWQRSAPVHLYMALSAGAALYLASALLRVVMHRRAASIDEIASDETTLTETTLTRMASGEYEGPITLSAALATLAIFRKASGPWIGAGLLLEGEVLFLAGMQFGQTYLRQLAGAVFTTSVARILGFDVPAGGKTVIVGRAWVTWSPVAMSAAILFYINRVLRKQALNLLEGTLYSSVAAALICLVLTYETPQQYVCVAWLVFATVLFELGVRTRKIEFLYQSYVIGVLGTGAGLLANVFVSDPTWQHPWIPIAIVAALHYAVALRMRSVDSVDGVNDTARWCASASAVAFLSALVWKLAPADYLGLAWLLLGAAIFELGMRKLPEQFRGLSYVVSAGAFARLLYFDVVLVSKDSVPAVAMSLGFSALVCYAMSARVFRPAQDAIESNPLQRDLPAYRDLNCAAATLFLLTLIWLKLPVAVVALAWAVVSLVILEIGFSFSLARFRIIGNLTAHAAFGRLFLANFTNLGDTLRISHRMLTALPIAISEYYVWWRYKNAEVKAAESWARVYLYAPAILIFVLMRFELGRSVAVVGWALLCVALFRMGLALRIADFRWQSYAIAIVAFWRCWNTNFYIPESLAGMPGRVVAGTAVIVSFYVAQLMAPREPAEGTLGFIDRHARTFYSLLGSVLLAAMLFYEVSGGVLTMAWGTEALLLLGAGFPLRDRLQRLSGLFLFLICVLKLFFFDLRQLETINRILSFIVLGVILVSVSWIYTRFRDRIQRYL
jgi:uncharacterized membrane protein